MQTIIKPVPFGSDEQIASVALRDKVLRKPLGLKFDPADLKKEYLEFHIAAFEGKQIVGVLLLKPTEDEEIIKMRQVAVDPDWQGKGIGKSLVSYSETVSRENGFTKIELHARESAVPFYEALGYTIEGEAFKEIGLPHYKMVKYLND